MWFKLCPKCGGDLFLRTGVDRDDVVCFQCGRILNDLEEIELAEAIKEKARQRGHAA